MQQIARVVIDDQDLTPKQQEALEKIMDLSRVPEVYNSGLYDPVKGLARVNQDYLREHAGEYLGLWLEIGISHPTTYMKAFIDQTKGYWNGGYWKWRWLDYIYKNDYGIYMTTKSEIYNDFTATLFGTMPRNDFLVMFLCIGMHVWAIGVLAFLSFLRRDKKGLFITLPVLAVIVSLLMATPVYSEFRYAYSVFTCFPFMLLAVLGSVKSN